MQIHVNTDSNIRSGEDLSLHIKGVVEHALSHFSDRVTRVEVHLSDQNSDKHGADDKRCMMEARLEGRQPTAVTCEAASVRDAIGGAADKLRKSLEGTVDRQKRVRRS